MGFADSDGLFRRFARIWFVIVLSLAMVISPYFLKGVLHSGENTSTRSIDIVFGNHFLQGLLFMAAFAMNFGMTFWVSFVAGLVMYRNLHLHTFGQIQSKLFPIYFTIGLLTGVIMLGVTIFQIRSLNKLTYDQETLIGAVAVIVMANVLNKFWLGPVSTSIMMKKHKMEKEENDKNKLDQNLMYRDLKKKFGKIHGMSTLLNLAAMVSNVYVLYWLAISVQDLAEISIKTAA
uniref:transmembrane protein 205-like n=1 Tax=Styela clava TaxID=7725 RepID=UPI00193A9C29|nr:transmembrane protein 205-like [Styela clava]